MNLKKKVLLIATLLFFYYCLAVGVGLLGKTLAGYDVTKNGGLCNTTNVLYLFGGCASVGTIVIALILVFGGLFIMVVGSIYESCERIGDV